MDFYGAKHTEEELEHHYNNCYLSSKDYMPVCSALLREF
jgi:hypothetical protein